MPKSIVKLPAPTSEPVLLTAELTRECAEASWLTTKEEFISSLLVVPTVLCIATSDPNKSPYAGDLMTFQELQNYLQLML